MVADCPSITVTRGALNKSVPCLRFNALIMSEAWLLPMIIPSLPIVPSWLLVKFVRGDTPAPIGILPGKLGKGF
jgi:hypothetical protein